MHLVIYLFKRICQATRTRNTEMNEPLKGPKTNRRSSQSCKLQNKNASREPWYWVTAILMPWVISQHLNLDPDVQWLRRLCVSQTSYVSPLLARACEQLRVMSSFVLQLGLAAPRLHLQQHVPFHFYSPPLSEHLWLWGNWAHDFQKKHQLEHMGNVCSRWTTRGKHRRMRFSIRFSWVNLF